MDHPEIEIKVDDRTVLTLTPPVVLGHERSGDSVNLRVQTTVRDRLDARLRIHLILAVRLTREELVAIASDLGLQLTDVEGPEG